MTLYVAVSEIKNKDGRRNRGNMKRGEKESWKYVIHYSTKQKHKKKALDLLDNKSPNSLSWTLHKLNGRAWKTMHFGFGKYQKKIR